MNICNFVIRKFKQIKTLRDKSARRVLYQGTRVNIF